jgi:predicted trehalose synthase
MPQAAALDEDLAGWIQRQRWFAGKGATPRLRMLDMLEWPSQHGVQVATHFVLDESEGRGALYQVPVTYRDEQLEGAEGAYIGRLPDPAGMPRHAYDAPHDPEFARRLLRLIVEQGRVEGRRSADGRSSAEGHGSGEEPGTADRPSTAAWGVAVRQDGDASSDAELWRATVLSSRVMSAEQSNTSIVYSLDSLDGEAEERHAICKVFRTLHHGENPDVVLQSALYAAGSASVPAVIGSVAGQWPDAGRADGQARGHLAFAQQFLTGAADAWQLALSAAAGGTAFLDSARQMGEATADVHSVLGSALPTRAAAPADVSDILTGWRERLDAAAREVPELDELRSPIERLYVRAADAEWPRLQRIHGDLHLGQILAVPGGHWVIIDFEGEPMRSLASRSEVDVPLRDVAGMLRSFDYVAGACGDTPGAREWARACRDAFLEGYRDRAGHDATRQNLLLDAFELDKALYEAVYEARNRPSWLAIPIAAARRLASAVED